MSKGLIIVVDDNPNFRKLYSDFLSVHGYTVMTAKGGEEALSLLVSCKPKVLILDVSMPEMDGIETCKRIRHEYGSGLPIIFLTSFNDVEKLRDCMHAGGDDFMIKSDKLTAILERVAFWSTGSNQQAARQRRVGVVQEIDEAVVNSQKPESDYNLDDALIEEMSQFIESAPAITAVAEAAPSEKLPIVLGYSAGVVKFWSSNHDTIAIHFLDYLKAVLTVSSVVTSAEITEAIRNFDQLSGNITFQQAREQASADSQAIQGDREAPPSEGMAASA